MKAKRSGIYLDRKVVNGNIGFDRGVLTVPQWCAFLLPRLVRDFGSKMRQKC